MRDNGTVKIPIERYDFLKGLELLINKNDVSMVLDNGYGVKYYTADDVIKEMVKEMDIENRKLKDKLFSLKRMTSREFRRWRDSV